MTSALCREERLAPVDADFDEQRAVMRACDELREPLLEPEACGQRCSGERNLCLPEQCAACCGGSGVRRLWRHGGRDESFFYKWIVSHGDYPPLDCGGWLRQFGQCVADKPGSTRAGDVDHGFD